MLFFPVRVFVAKAVLSANVEGWCNKLHNNVANMDPCVGGYICDSYPDKNLSCKKYFNHICSTPQVFATIIMINPMNGFSTSQQKQLKLYPRKQLVKPTQSVSSEQNELGCWCVSNRTDMWSDEMWSGACRQVPCTWTFLT